MTENEMVDLVEDMIDEIQRVVEDVIYDSDVNMSDDEHSEVLRRVVKRINQDGLI